MTFQEKQRVASIINSVLVFGIYFAVVIQMYQDGRFDGADANTLLGKSILLLIIAGIILTIMVTIIFNIVFAIANKESNPSFVVDERDKLIELRGMRISSYITGAGVVLAMGALALGQSTFLVFNLIISSFALGGLIGDLAMLTIYRRGF